MKKQVLVTVDRGETRVAMLEASGDPGAPTKSSRGRGGRRRKTNTVPDGYRVAEIYFERRGGRSIVGNIYKGRVDNVLAGLEAAFVDIGLDKNGFLHVDEIVIPGVEQAKRGRGSGPRITDLLKPGQEITVQVVKDPLKTKGARLSMELTIAGRYMVFAPTGEGVGVSRRLEDKERDRLRKEAKQLDLGGGGAIIRTAAHGATRADFERELQYLFKLNEVLEKRVKETAAPALVFQEADLSVRVVRDIFSEHFERAVVDDELAHHRLVSFFTRTAPELVDRVELYDGDDSLFEEYGVDPVINGMLERRVDLPSGGYLIIDYAEALTVIDVNTGSFTGKGKSARLEDTITQTNLEAAEEAVRQLRLRDIGGIIVIDFIDMARSRNRDAVLKVLRKSLDEDRTKTFVVEISPLGLVEMTRQNVTDGVREIMTNTCAVCHGEGVVKSAETIAIEFSRHMRHMVKDAGAEGPEAYLLRVNPKVTAFFIADGARELHELEAETGRWFHFEGSDGLPLDYFAVTMEGSRREIEEHAVPFRAGEEVHVHLVEPHMYNEDDAVAKVDGYLIDVVNGVHFVGEKKMVRIEEAGRTIAQAVLVGPDAEVAEEAAKERAAAREKAVAAARRTAASKKAPKRRPRDEVQEAAVATLADESEDRAGTAPAAEEDSDGAPRKRRRRGGRGRGRGRGGANADGNESVDAVAEDGATDEDAPRSRRRGGGDAEVVAGEDGSAAPSDDDAPRSRSRRRRGAAVDADETSTDTPAVEADEDAPRGRSRRRRGAAVDADAEAAAVQAADEAVAAGEVVEDEAPRSRSRRRRGGADADAGREAAAQAADEAVAAGEVVEDEAPRSRSRRRRGGAEADAGREAAVQAADEAVAAGEVVEDEAPRARSRRRRGGAVDEPVAPSEAAEAEVVEEVPLTRSARRRAAAQAAGDAADEVAAEAAPEPVAAAEDVPLTRSARRRAAAQPADEAVAAEAASEPVAATEEVPLTRSARRRAAAQAAEEAVAAGAVAEEAAP
ncbi:Rne/Rng family ribonuclease, partial [Solirubrobacter phytolaccae]